MNDSMKTATKRLARFSAAHRRVFEVNGYVDGMQIVLAMDSDLINDVMDRVQSHEPPVLIAVYFPTRTGRNEFTFVQAQPSVTRSGESEPERVTGTATIGMFADDLEGRGPGLVHPFRVRRAWSNMDVRTFAHA